MNLTDLLKKYNLKPRKGLGQNFLTDPHHLDKIIEAADLTATDTVLEIGPGPGMLTLRLVQRAGQVFAVELDKGMVNLLQMEYGHLPNLTIVAGDILQTNPADLLSTISDEPHPDESVDTPQIAIHGSQSTPYQVVANLPYYITSAVLRHLLESSFQPTRIVVTVQQEVARRIVAKPGQMSLLAVSVQFYGQPALVHRIPAGAFYPPPNVDSAVLRIDTYGSQRPVAVTDINWFFQVVKAGFSQKRKQLKNTLAAGLRLPDKTVIEALEQAGIEPRWRAQRLSLPQWGRLVEVLGSKRN